MGLGYFEICDANSLKEMKGEALRRKEITLEREEKQSHLIRYTNYVSF